MKKIALILIGLLVATGVYADRHRVLQDCKTDQIRVEKQQLILHTAVDHKPQIVLLHNISKSELLINHTKVHPSAGAGWSSYLRPDNWSALLVVQPKFSLVCQKINDDKYIPVACAKVLKACALTRFRDESKTVNGTYWLIENTSLYKVLQAVKLRKIILNISN